jgi:hypothetical protein
MTLPQTASINSYGGLLEDALPVVDPTSEIDAASLNALSNDCSAMTSTAPRALLQFTTGASGENPAIYSSSNWTTGFDSVWGNASGYLPTFTYAGTGVYIITYPASVPDQLGNLNPLIVRAATVDNLTYNEPCFFNTLSTGNQTSVFVYNSSGDAANIANLVLFVEIF